jgi:hypothetical protein
MTISHYYQLAVTNTNCARFQHKLPAYLALPPEMIEVQHSFIDEEIVMKVCYLPIKDVNPESVREAVTLTNKRGIASSSSTSLVAPHRNSGRERARHELRVAYELLLDAKRHKQRIADVVLALQDSSRTPPGQARLLHVQLHYSHSLILCCSLTYSHSLILTDNVTTLCCMCNFIDLLTLSDTSRVLTIRPL